jgi:hypothetical protein
MTIFAVLKNREVNHEIIKTDEKDISAIKEEEDK